MKLAQFISEFGDQVKQFIIEAEAEKLTGEEKKAKVDKLIMAWAITALSSLQCNFFIKLGIKYLINNCIPVITQKIFDFLQAKVPGITKTVRA